MSYEYEGTLRYAFEVCEQCYRTRPESDLIRKGCYRYDRHARVGKVLVTAVEGGRLKSVRPFPQLAVPRIGENRWFVVCDGRRCPGNGRCCHPHTQAEADVWNTKLAMYRKTRTASHPVPSQPLLTQQPLSSVTTPAQPRAQPSKATNECMVAGDDYDGWPDLPNLERNPTSNVTSVSNLHAQKKNTFEGERPYPHSVQDAVVELTRSTYKKKFHALLHFEEQEHKEILAKKCDGHYKLYLLEDGAELKMRQCRKAYSRYGYLLGMTGDKIEYAAQADQTVFITKQAATTAGASTFGDRMVDACVADILEVDSADSCDKVCLGFCSEQIKRLGSHFPVTKQKCAVDAHVKFAVNHQYFDMLHQTLDKLSSNCIARIMPEGEDFEEGLDLSCIFLPCNYPFLKLDQDSQLRAFKLAVYSKSRAPVLIPGPFGTGKTRLLAVASHFFIHEAKRRSARLLVCCHHPSSADAFVEQYLGCMQGNEGFQSMVKLVRVTDGAYFYMPKFEKYYIPVVELKKKIKYYTADPNFKHFVFVSTFLTSLCLRDVLEPQFFTHILIDEGTQTCEPETIASLCLANPDTKIIIAGDAQQVGPKLLVLGKLPQDNGLAVSLLERLCQLYTSLGHSKYIASLCTNYRCHKDLLELSSSLFYHQPSLMAAAKVSLVPTYHYPLKFVSSDTVYDEHLVNDTSQSEAEILLDELWQLKQSNRPGCFLNEDFCITAVNRNQVKVIHDLMKRNYPTLEGIQILPTYKVKGQEFRVLLLSTVEYVDPASGKSADPTKSLCNPYVFNTAITRAQSLVVATGNPFTLLAVEAKMSQPKFCWREFLKCCKRNKMCFIRGIGQKPQLKKALDFFS